MRAFIAINIPTNIQDSLFNLQSQLQSTGADVKWVKPSNIHITLKFLGEITEEKAVKVASIIKEVVFAKVKFNASLNSLGAFPNINFPKIIWAGIKNSDSKIREIAQDLEEKLGKSGFPKEERPFTSHLTIGRVKTQRNIAKLISKMKACGENLIKNGLEFPVDSIIFYKSILTGTGPIYEVLGKEELK